jgi:hypothetical protein
MIRGGRRLSYNPQPPEVPPRRYRNLIAFLIRLLRLLFLQTANAKAKNKFGHTPENVTAKTDNNPFRY